MAEASGRAAPGPEVEDVSELALLARGDTRAWKSLLQRYRAELQDFIACHFDPRLRARVDASDIVQETQIELVRRMDDFLASRPMPFRLWLRKKAIAAHPGLCSPLGPEPQAPKFCGRG